jgi:hypothetical protein
METYIEIRETIGSGVRTNHGDRKAGPIPMLALSRGRSVSRPVKPGMNRAVEVRWSESVEPGNVESPCIGGRKSLYLKADNAGAPA